MRFALLALPLAFLVKRPAPGQWPRLIGVCLLIGVLHFGLSFTALKMAGDLSSPAIVMQSYVPMTTLLAWWWLGERFAWRTGLAIAMSFAGVLVLGFDPLVLDRPMALVLMLISAAFLAHRHRADEGPARPGRLQPAGLDGIVQRAAAAGDQRHPRARRDGGTAFGELGRLGRRAVRGVRLIAARPWPVSTCWCNGIRWRR